MINFFANSAYSSIAPFFPEEAKSKNVEEYAGLIFSGYSIPMLILSPVFGKLLTCLGRRNVLMLGCLCEGIAMLIFGFLIYVDDPLYYGLAAFSCRFIEGFGNGCLNSASTSIINFYYSDNTSNLIGLTQTFTGLGMLSGPLIGTLFVEIGGFTLPFLVVGSLLILLMLPIPCFLPND